MAGIIFIGFAIWAISYLFGNTVMDLIERNRASKRSKNVVHVVNDDEK